MGSNNISKYYLAVNSTELNKDCVQQEQLLEEVHRDLAGWTYIFSPAPAVKSSQHQLLKVLTVQMHICILIGYYCTCIYCANFYIFVNKIGMYSKATAVTFFILFVPMQTVGQGSSDAWAKWETGGVCVWIHLHLLKPSVPSGLRECPAHEAADWAFGRCGLWVWHQFELHRFANGVRREAAAVHSQGCWRTRDAAAMVLCTRCSFMEYQWQI